MTSRRRAALMAMALLLSPVATVHAQVSTDQAALAARLLGDDMAEQSRALASVEAQGLQHAGPALRAALITALGREGTVLARRDAAHRRGEIVEAHPNPEYILQLSRLVADMRCAASTTFARQI